MFLNQLNGRERNAFMYLAHELILSEGVIAQQEKDMMLAYCAEMSLESYEHDKDFKNEAWKILSELSAEMKNSLYIELYALAICEGDFDETERMFLKNLCNKFDITDDKRCQLEAVMDKLNDVYAEIYRVIND